MPRVYLSAEPGEDGGRGFLARVEQMCKLKRGTLEQHLQALRDSGANAHCEVFYKSWQELAKASEDGVLDAELQGAFDTVQRLGEERVEQAVAAIRAAKVADKSQADYIFSTCHKYKGEEEDWVQLADDFRPIAAGVDPNEDRDEYCLLFVAVTRAKKALVLNRDLQQLMSQQDPGQAPPLLLSKVSGDA
ncbi:hypothetical protein OEZ85_013826 [Tetradesmus obliquus]|uniref:DNA helicase n=1 Tax=Tetradesmus obliquus TaxID=3088 RepID=A0ABY8U620_TETOB|nr:hypothetical protein OEZ85_013826 [Tetradesmus obliquus]